MRPARARLLVPSAVLVLLPTALGACGGSSSGGVGSSSSSTAAPSGAQGSSGNSITATETEYHIALSSATASAGQVTFVVKNAGQVTHDLVVNGPGVAAQKTALLSPGQTVHLVVTLQAGSYDIYCDIPGHKQAGMDAKLTVS